MRWEAFGEIAFGNGNEDRRGTASLRAEDSPVTNFSLQSYFKNARGVAQLVLFKFLAYGFFHERGYSCR